MNQKRIRAYLRRNGFTEVWGDTDLTCGATFVRDRRDWFDVIVITDLASACGGNGQTVVESRVTSFGYLDRQDWEKVKAHADTSSWLPEQIKEDKAFARLCLAADIIECGISGPADSCGYNRWVAVIDPIEAKGAVEYWTKHRVPGWGCAALMRAIRAAVCACD